MKYPATVKYFLIVSFLGSIFLVGIAQAFIDVGQGERPQIFDLFMQKPIQSNLRSFESDLEKSSWFSKQLQPWMRFLQFVVLKDTGDKALLGKDGWFFYRPGYRYLVEDLPENRNPENSNNEVVAAAIDFRDRLKARGIELLVVPAPGKASVYPEKLTIKKSESVSAHTKETISALREKGIHVFDLLEAFKETKKAESFSAESPLYLVQDTHWAPLGIQQAARALAKHVLESGWAVLGETEYRLKTLPLQRYGDVLRMVDIPFTEKLYDRETIECTQVLLGDGLYQDDPASPILIVGDSFLRIFERDEPKSAGLISHLAYELKRPLASIVSDGGASTLVRQELARKPELLQNKKLVIWEFVERDIRFGTEGWQKVSLR